jgi:hypothetical protein
MKVFVFVPELGSRPACSTTAATGRHVLADRSVPTWMASMLSATSARPGVAKRPRSRRCRWPGDLGDRGAAPLPHRRGDVEVRVARMLQGFSRARRRAAAASGVGALDGFLRQDRFRHRRRQRYRPWHLPGAGAERRQSCAGRSTGAARHRARGTIQLQYPDPRHRARRFRCGGFRLPAGPSNAPSMRTENAWVVVDFDSASRRDDMDDHGPTPAAACAAPVIGSSSRAKMPAECSTSSWARSPKENWLMK